MSCRNRGGGRADAASPEAGGSGCLWGCHTSGHINARPSIAGWFAPQILAAPHERRAVLAASARLAGALHGSRLTAVGVSQRRRGATGRPDVRFQGFSARRAAARGGWLDRDRALGARRVDVSDQALIRGLAAASPIMHSGGLSEIPCVGLHDAAEGGILCDDARSRRPRMRVWTIIWAGRIPGPPWPRVAC
jgi:hypothetical protein